MTRPPELLEAAAPVYPPEAAARGREATVPIQIDIDANGAVTAVRVLQPARDGFDEAAVAAAQQYRFRPAEVDGKPAPITIETAIHFKLQTVEAPTTTSDQHKDPTTSLGGSVRERGTRKKLAGVSVGIPDLGVETSTDAEGSFRFDKLPAGTHRIVAVLTGYDRFTDTVTLKDGQPGETILYLKPTLSSDYETVLRGEREKTEVTRHNVQRRELTTVPGTFGDPLRVIQNLPGLARAPWASGLLLVRGSNPNNSGVFVDGHWIPLLYHFLGGPSILNPEFLDSIDLYPGGFPARFGRFSGGIIEVNTRPTASDGFHGAAKVDVFDTGVYVRVPVTDGVTFAAAGRRSYIDAILPFVLNPDPGEELVVVPVYWDYQTRVDVDLPGRSKLTLSVFGSDDRLEVLQTNAETQAVIDLDSHIGFHRARVGYVRPLSSKMKLTMSQIVGLDKLSVFAAEQTSTDITNTSAGSRLRVSGEIAPRWSIDAGFDLDYRDTNYDLTVPNNQDFRVILTRVEIPPELIQRSIDVLGLAGYIELAWNITDDFRLIPALRADTYLLNGKPRAALDPRLVARWSVTDMTTLKAYGGLFHEPPTPEALDNLFGNPNLELQRAIHTGVGIEQKLGRHVTLDAEVYYNWRDDFATFTDEVERRDDGTLRPLNFVNGSVGSSYGLELLLKHEVTERFYGWISYTLSRSDVRRLPDRPLVPQPFDQTHNFIGVASYRFGDGWEAGARFRFTTGRPITPIVGATFDSDRNNFEPLQGDQRSDRRDTFHELDLRVDKTWVFDTWQIGVYLDVINVYNAENAEATQYDYRFRNTAPVRGVPIVPTLGVKGQW